MPTSRFVFFLLALSLLANLFFFVTSQEQQPAPAQALGDDLNNQLVNDLPGSVTLDSPTKTGLMPKSKQPFPHLRLEPQLRHLQQLFELNQFDRLVAEWESLSAYYPDQALQLKGQWLAEIKQGLRAKEIDRGLLFLDAWSTRFANDFDVEWIKATDQFSRENRIDAVDVMFSLVDELSGVEHEIYSHQKNTIIEAKLGTLKSNSDWTSLIKLLEHLLWYQPSNDLYILEIADAYFQLGQYQQSIFRLESLIGHAYYGKRAQKILDELNRLSLVKAMFPLIKQSAHYLIEGAVGLAKIFNVSEEIIGLSVVAVGTSLPELATTFSAVWRRQGEVVLGNIIGSNLFNILFIVGIAAIIAPLGMNEVELIHSLGYLFISLMLFMSIIVRPRVIRRLWGFIFVSVYATYLWFLVG